MAWRTISALLNLAAIVSANTITYEVDDQANASRQLQVAYTGVSSVTPPIEIPGILQAEAFDDGENTYFLNPPLNEERFQNEIRIGVDGIGVDVTIATISELGVEPPEYSVRAVRPGDWLRYTINVLTAGTYSPTWTIAQFKNGNATPYPLTLFLTRGQETSEDPCNVTLQQDGLLKENIDTDGWRNFVPFVGANVHFETAGAEVVTVCLYEHTNFEFDSITFTLVKADVIITEAPAAKEQESAESLLFPPDSNPSNAIPGVEPPPTPSPTLGPTVQGSPLAVNDTAAAPVEKSSGTVRGSAEMVRGSGVLALAGLALLLGL